MQDRIQGKTHTAGDPMLKILIYPIEIIIFIVVLVKKVIF